CPTKAFRGMMVAQTVLVRFGPPTSVQSWPEFGLFPSTQNPPEAGSAEASRTPFASNWTTRYWKERRSMAARTSTLKSATSVKLWAIRPPLRRPAAVLRDQVGPLAVDDRRYLELIVPLPEVELVALRDK